MSAWFLVLNLESKEFMEQGYVKNMDKLSINRDRKLNRIRNTGCIFVSLILTFDGVIFTLISDGGGRADSVHPLSIRKTIEKVNFWDIFAW